MNTVLGPAVGIGFLALTLWGCVSLRDKGYVIAVALTCFTSVMAGCGFSFQYRPLNFCVVIVAIGGYVYFSFASFAIRPKILGALTGTVLTAPVILGVLSLPFTGLGLIFIVGDMVTPYSVVQIRDGIVCRTRSIGSAATGDGVAVELVRPIFGFANRTIYDYSNTPTGTYADDAYRDPCSDAYAKLESSER